MHQFTKDLLAWYKKYGRDLPWRNTVDPYHIMVSEFMLQQTQVPRVIPKYEQFLQTFPTIYALAKAPLSGVLTLWSGLGYNRRAKFLWHAAKDIVEKHNGVVPQDKGALEKLHGFGPYTASAVLAFAYNKPEIVIDANVKNVLNKVFGVDEKQISRLLEQLLAKNHARDFYNALMDIGSLYYKKNSDYQTYPFKAYCFWHNNKPIPNLKKIKQPAFKESNRFYRGQILKNLTQNKSQRIAEFEGPYKKALDSLLKEGLVVCEQEQVYLPKNL